MLDEACLVPTNAGGVGATRRVAQSSEINVVIY
jgi:hypothetical protein